MAAADIGQTIETEARGTLGHYRGPAIGAKLPHPARSRPCRVIVQALPAGANRLIAIPGNVGITAPNRHLLLPERVDLRVDRRVRGDTERRSPVQFGCRQEIQLVLLRTDIGFLIQKIQIAIVVECDVAGPGPGILEGFTPTDRIPADEIDVPAIGFVQSIEIRTHVVEHLRAAPRGNVLGLDHQSGEIILAVLWIDGAAANSVRGDVVVLLIGNIATEHTRIRPAKIQGAGLREAPVRRALDDRILRQVLIGECRTLAPLEPSDLIQADLGLHRIGRPRTAVGAAIDAERLVGTAAELLAEAEPVILVGFALLGKVLGGAGHLATIVVDGLVRIHIAAAGQCGKLALTAIGVAGGAGTVHRTRRGGRDRRGGGRTGHGYPGPQAHGDGHDPHDQPARHISTNHSVSFPTTASAPQHSRFVESPQTIMRDNGRLLRCTATTCGLHAKANGVPLHAAAAYATYPSMIQAASRIRFNPRERLHPSFEHPYMSRYAAHRTLSKARPLSTTHPNFVDVRRVAAPQFS